MLGDILLAVAGVVAGVHAAAFGLIFFRSIQTKSWITWDGQRYFFKRW